jgi:hypothetical protein
MDVPEQYKIILEKRKKKKCNCGKEMELKDYHIEQGIESWLGYKCSDCGDVDCLMINPDRLVETIQQEEKEKAQEKKEKIKVYEEDDLRFNNKRLGYINNFSESDFSNCNDMSKISQPLLGFVEQKQLLPDVYFGTNIPIKQCPECKGLMFLKNVTVDQSYKDINLYIINLKLYCYNCDKDFIMRKQVHRVIHEV